MLRPPKDGGAERKAATGVCLTGQEGESTAALTWEVALQALLSSLVAESVL